MFGAKAPEIPEKRRQRGSAGAFLREGKLYLVSGLTDGHRSGWVPWFDEYDFETGHVEASYLMPLELAGSFSGCFDRGPAGPSRWASLGGRAVVSFASVIKEVDVYDFWDG